MTIDLFGFLIMMCGWAVTEIAFTAECSLTWTHPKWLYRSVMIVSGVFIAIGVALILVGMIGGGA